jgi:hypothetical protein
MRNAYKILVETNADQLVDIGITGKVIFIWLGEIKGEDVDECYWLRMWSNGS